MTEYGVFSGGTIIEGGFRSMRAARAALTDKYATVDGLAVHEICPTECEHEWHKFGTINGVPDVACQICGARRNE